MPMAAYFKLNDALIIRDSLVVTCSQDFSLSKFTGREFVELLERFEHSLPADDQALFWRA